MKLPDELVQSLEEAGFTVSYNSCDGDKYVQIETKGSGQKIKLSIDADTKDVLCWLENCREILLKLYDIVTVVTDYLNRMKKETEQ